MTALDVREVAVVLPRAYEAWVRDHRKFRVASLVFASVSPDETQLGFGFPREGRTHRAGHRRLCDVHARKVSRAWFEGLVER